MLELFPKLIEGVDHDIADAIYAQDALQRTLHLGFGQQVGLHLVPGHLGTLGRFPCPVFIADRDEAVPVVRFGCHYLPNLYRPACSCSTPFRSPAATSAWQR